MTIPQNQAKCKYLSHNHRYTPCQHPQGVVTITRLMFDDLPWRYALKIIGVDRATFRDFIYTLKIAIPPRARKWKAEGRCWLLRDCDPAIGLAQSYGLTIECSAITVAPETDGAA